MLIFVLSAALSHQGLVKSNPETLETGASRVNELGVRLADKSKGKKKKPKSTDAADEDQRQDASDSQGGSRGDSSASARVKKAAGVAVGGGAVVGSAGGFDIEGYWAANSTLQLGVAYMSGQKDLGTIDDANYTVSDFGVTAQMALVRARYFFANSFNGSLLLGQRLIHGRATIESKTSSDRVVFEVNSSSTVFGVTVGNHWAWANGLTIGADWYGYYLPLASSSSSSTTTEGTISAAHQQVADDAEKAAEELGKTPNDQALVATLGYMF